MNAFHEDLAIEFDVVATSFLMSPRYLAASNIWIETCMIRAEEAPADASRLADNAKYW
jgi:hypothetical protein